MKVLILAFILTYISAIGSFEIKKIEGVEGEGYVFFDSKFNSFLYLMDENYVERLYKLDPDNNVLFVKETVDKNCVTMLNHKDEVYLICGWYNPDHNAYSWDLDIIRANSSETERVTSLSANLSLLFGDNAGNLVYNINDYSPGFFFWRYNTTELVRVKNLEDFVVKSSYYIKTDQNGDTYIAGWTGDLEKNRFIVIPADSKEEAPEGHEVEGILDEPTKDRVRQFSVTSNNEVLISVTDDNGTGSVKKISNGTVTTIYANEGQYEYSIFAGEKQTIIAAFDVLHAQDRITSLTPDGEIVEISNSRNEPWPYTEIGVLFDQEGNVFIGWSSEEEKRTYLEFLNYTDTTTVEVDLGDIRLVHNILFDGNNNLWISTYDNGVYFIERGSLEVQHVPNSSNDFRGMWVNPKKKVTELFFITGAEVDVISN